MLKSRLHSCLLCAGGLGCLLAALESDSVAVDCSPTEFSPYTCLPAHEEPIVNGSTDMTCRMDAGDGCVPGPGSECGGDLGWGIVVAGECQLQPASSTPYQCTQEYGITIVDLHHWRSNCTNGSQGCACEVYADLGDESSRVEICDCMDEDV